TGINHDLLEVCLVSIAGVVGAAGFGAGAGAAAAGAGVAASFPLALSRTARSAACCAAYAWTFRRTHSPGRPGSDADRRRYRVSTSLNSSWLEVTSLMISRSAVRAVSTLPGADAYWPYQSY